MSKVYIQSVVLPFPLCWVTDMLFAVTKQSGTDFLYVVNNSWVLWLPLHYLCEIALVVRGWPDVIVMENQYAVWRELETWLGYVLYVKLLSTELYKLDIIERFSYFYPSSFQRHFPEGHSIIDRELSDKLSRSCLSNHRGSYLAWG